MSRKAFIYFLVRLMLTVFVGLFSELGELKIWGWGDVGGDG
jgi:hypothetical protein